MKHEIAKILLEIKAVNLSPDDFFTWTSGIKSPIYCDNRQIISYPEYRNVVVDKFVNLIKDQYSNAEVIAGTATAGIPWAAWIADKLNLPMIYIRGSAKGHGLKNAIEGKVDKGQKVVLIEDLISTGKSSVAAAKEIQNDELELLTTLSIFTYGLDLSKEKFAVDNLTFTSLCDIDALLEYAGEENLLTDEQIAIIKEWKNTIKLN
jgi:orotate phosphoribosyltransferase